jgi:hypothetical protein
MNRAFTDPSASGDIGPHRAMGRATTSPFHRCSLMMRSQVFGSILMGAHVPRTKLTNPAWYETVP